MSSSNPISPNYLGVIRLLCNLPFWMAVAFGIAHPCLNSDGTEKLSMLILGLGVVLGFVAASKGSGLWAWAAALPFVSFIAGIVITFKFVGLFPCGM